MLPSETLRRACRLSEATRLRVERIGSPQTADPEGCHSDPEPAGRSQRDGLVRSTAQPETLLSADPPGFQKERLKPALVRGGIGPRFRRVVHREHHETILLM